MIIFLRVSNSWFASCSDKRLRCSRGKTGTAGNLLKTVRTKPFMSGSCCILKKVTVCFLLSVVSSFLELLTAQLLQSSSGAPSGLQLHILDLYMTELAAVGSAEVQKHRTELCQCLTRCKTLDEASCSR